MLLRQTWFQLDGLLLGCALAALMPMIAPRTPRPGISVGILLLGVPVAVVSPLPAALVPALAAVTGTLAIYFATRGNEDAHTGWGAVLNQRCLALTGQRSYGLYLWHTTAINLLLLYGTSFTFGVGIGLPLAWLMTTLSWHFIEQPAQRWYRRRSSPRRAAYPPDSFDSVQESSPR